MTTEVTSESFNVSFQSLTRLADAGFITRQEIQHLSEALELINEVPVTLNSSPDGKKDFEALPNASFSQFNGRTMPQNGHSQDSKEELNLDSTPNGGEDFDDLDFNLGDYDDEQWAESQPAAPYRELREDYSSSERFLRIVVKPRLQEIILPNSGRRIRINPNEQRVYEGVVKGLNRDEVISTYYAHLPRAEAERLFDSGYADLSLSLGFAGYSLSTNIDNGQHIFEITQKEMTQLELDSCEHQPSVYTLSDDDIEDITGYEKAINTITDRELRLLSECLQYKSRIFPADEDLDKSIEKINYVLLRKTGLKIRLSEIVGGDLSEIKLIGNNRNPSALRRLIEIRTKIAQKKASIPPPFRIQQEVVNGRLSAALKNKAGESTKPVNLRNRYFKVDGEEISNINPIGQKGLAYTIDFTNQLKLIKILLGKPVDLRTAVMKKFNDTTGAQTHTLKEAEFQSLLQVTDEILNTWGLAIKVFDRNGDEFCQLAKLTPEHVKPVMQYKVANYEEEWAALPDRKRRRQPSTGKIRL